MTSEARSWGGTSGRPRPEWSPRGDPIIDGVSGMRSEELEALLAITEAFSSGDNVSEILNSLYRELHAILPYDRLEYSVVDDTGYGLKTEWFKATYDTKLIPLGHVYVRDTMVSTDPKYRVTTVDNDLPAYARTRPSDHPVSLLADEGLRSSLSCPLIVDDLVTGFLFFNSKQYGTYTPHHKALIQLISGQIAAVLERTRLNDQLRARNRKLQELEQQRLEFIASISHELRTPLTAVVGFASEMQDRIEDFDPQELRQFSSVIAAQSAEVSGIVEDLLVITRAEAGHLTVTPCPINLSTELEPILSALPEDRPDQRITMAVVDAIAWADPLRVRQIVRNLLSNAMRYGGDDVRLSITVARDEAEVIVSDDGPGIPDGDMDLVFRAYGRSHLSKSKPGSIGLGLTVSRYLAEAMGGNLIYERVRGRSRFVLTLPVYTPGANGSPRVT